MKHFHIKSILLGIGIGIILTSIMSLIYLAGAQPEAKLSDEEIIEKAKALGMVEADSIFGNRNGSQGTTQDGTEDLKEDTAPGTGENADNINPAEDNGQQKNQTLGEADGQNSQASDKKDKELEQAVGNVGEDGGQAPSEAASQENPEEGQDKAEEPVKNDDEESGAEKKENNGAKKASLGDVIEFFIARGATSEEIAETLSSCGLISDKNEFTSIITKKNLTRKIEAGTYYIRKGTDVETIIKIITNQY